MKLNNINIKHEVKRCSNADFNYIVIEASVSLDYEGREMSMEELSKQINAAAGAVVIAINKKEKI
jgi:hypothetical protein